MDKAMLYDLIESYLEGALKVELESEFGRGYMQGLRSLHGYIEALKVSPVLQEMLYKKIA